MTRVAGCEWGGSQRDPLVPPGGARTPRSGGGRPPYFVRAFQGTQMQLDQRREALLKRTFIDYQQTAEFLAHPLIVERADGMYYWDIDGNRYFDAIGGIFVATLGHGHPRVLEAMRRQMDRMTFAPPLHGIADVTLDFVEKLGSVTPGSLKYVKPFSGGSESTEAALTFVRQTFDQTANRA